MQSTHRYACRLLFHLSYRWLDGSAAQLAEERIILVRAGDAKAALREANRLAKEDCVDTSEVKVRLLGVVELILLGAESPEHEVWYELKQTRKTVAALKAQLPKTGQLRAIVDEQADRAERAASTKTRVNKVKTSIVVKATELANRVLDPGIQATSKLARSKRKTTKRASKPA